MKARMIQNISNSLINKIMHSVSAVFFRDDIEKIIRVLLNCNRFGVADCIFIKILVAAEDKRFFKHPGFDIFAILRAIFFYITQRQRSGASTIEQQLVRTITQNKSNSFKRKIKEIILASALGYKFSKNKIAECYLSLAYYGHDINGLACAIKKISSLKYIRKDDIPFACIALLKFPLPSSQSEEYRGKLLTRISTIRDKINPADIKHFCSILSSGNTCFLSKVRGYIPIKAFCPANRCVPCKEDIEKIIYMYIFKNIPFFLRKKPLIYYEACHYISKNLNVDINDIFITGSANLGFSLAPQKYCRKYKALKSDLDFFVVSENLFFRLSEDIEKWKNDSNGKDCDKIKNAERMRDDRKFIDTWHIPVRYSETSKCRKTMYKVCFLINKLYGEKIVSEDGRKSSSIRCYKDYESAIRQISKNIADSLGKNRF